MERVGHRLRLYPNDGRYSNNSYAPTNNFTANHIRNNSNRTTNNTANISHYYSNNTSNHHHYHRNNTADHYHKHRNINNTAIVSAHKNNNNHNNNNKKNTTYSNNKINSNNKITTNIININVHNITDRSKTYTDVSSLKRFIQCTEFSRTGKTGTPVRDTGYNIDRYEKLSKDDLMLIVDFLKVPGLGNPSKADLIIAVVERYKSVLQSLTVANIRDVLSVTRCGPIPQVGKGPLIRFTIEVGF